MNTIQDKLRNAPLDARAAYIESRLVWELTDHVLTALEARNLTRAAFANTVGCDKSAITKFLGGRNVTLRTIAKFFAALEEIPSLTASPMFGTPAADDWAALVDTQPAVPCTQPAMHPDHGYAVAA